MKISVVIPTYNEAKYLPTALESFKNQTFKDYELIIADGKSSDDTEKIARKYTSNFITVKNSNVVKARDAGLKAAKGEW